MTNFVFFVQLLLQWSNNQTDKKICQYQTVSISVYETLQLF